MSIAFIFPSYNEMSNISRGVLEEVYDYATKQSYEWEIVLADDGSTDGTVEHLQAFAKTHKNTKVFAFPHRGKGPTVLEALEKTTTDFCLFSDFDQATPLFEVEKLLPFVNKNYDVVIGSREVAGAKRQKEPIHRHIMGKVFNFFVKMIAINGINDTQCGFKLFSRHAINTVVPKVFVYSGKGVQKGAFTGAFDVELLYLTQKFGLKIAEVPIVWKYAKTNRVDPIKDSVRMFRDILRIRLADLSGKYS